MRMKLFVWWWKFTHQNWKDCRQKGKALDAAITKQFGGRHCKNCVHRSPITNVCWCTESGRYFCKVGDYHSCKHFKKV